MSRHLRGRMKNNDNKRRLHRGNQCWKTAEGETTATRVGDSGGSHVVDLHHLKLSRCSRRVTSCIGACRVLAGHPSRHLRHLLTTDVKSSSNRLLLQYLMHHPTVSTEPLVSRDKVTSAASQSISHHFGRLHDHVSAITITNTNVEPASASSRKQQHYYLLRKTTTTTTKTINSGNEPRKANRCISLFRAYKRRYARVRCMHRHAGTAAIIRASSPRSGEMGGGGD